MDLYNLVVSAKLSKGGGGGDIDVDELSVTENGTYTASSGHAYSPVTVNVPNSYAASDEGKVVSNGALVGQTSATKTANGTYDTTLNNEVVVNVPGPSGSISITQNGTVDVTQYASADVNVSGGGGDDSFAKLVDGTIENAIVPEGVTKVKIGAFSYCDSLESVILPSTITAMGSNAFRDLPALKSLVIKATTPPTIQSDTFLNIPSFANLKIYVPSASVETYKSASNWNNYRYYIRAIPE